MGLDMYLERCSKDVEGYVGIDLEETKENNPELYKKLSPYIIQRGRYIHWEDLLEEVGYWRKANQIHKYFVENVQNGEDDCERYKVSKEIIEDLLYRCREIMCAYRNGDNLDENETWEDLANNLLPTQSGFFFGDTEFDDYYIADIESTVEILENVLKTTDFDTKTIFYTSSW